MIVSCPNCTTAYQVDSAAFGPGGRNLKCHKCTHVWWQSPPPRGGRAIGKLIIICPQCSREHSTDAHNVPAAGRNVRCDMCKHVWRTFPTHPALDPAVQSLVSTSSTEPPLPSTQAGAVSESSAAANAPTAQLATFAAEAPKPTTTIPVGAVANDDGLPYPPSREREQPQFAIFDNSPEIPSHAGRRPRAHNLAIGVALVCITLAGFGLNRYVMAPGSRLLNPFTALKKSHVELGVDLRDVSYTRQTAYGLGTVLTIHGKLANASATGLPTPHAIEIILTDGKNAKLYQTAVKPSVQKLGPGQSIAFTTNIYNAPEGAMHMQVSLVR